MIEKIKSLSNSKDLESLGEIDIDQLMLELVTLDNYEQQNTLNNQSITSFVLKDNENYKLVLYNVNTSLKNLKLPRMDLLKLIHGSINLLKKRSINIRNI